MVLLKASSVWNTCALLRLIGLQLALAVARGGGRGARSARAPRFPFHFHSPATNFPYVSEGLGTQQRAESCCLRIACTGGASRRRLPGRLCAHADAEDPFSPAPLRRGESWLSGRAWKMWLRGPQQFPDHRAADGVRLPQAQTRPGVPRTAEDAEQSRAQRQPGKGTGGKQSGVYSEFFKIPPQRAWEARSEDFGGQVSDLRNHRTTALGLSAK